MIRLAARAYAFSTKLTIYITEREPDLCEAHVVRFAIFPLTDVETLERFSGSSTLEINVD